MENQSIPILTQPIPSPTTPPVLPPKKSSNGKILMIGFFAIILMVYVGIFYFYLLKPQEKAPSQTTTSQQAVPTSQTSSPTEIYTNQDFAYSLSFPSGTTYTADKNVDKALPDYLGSFSLDLPNNPQAFEINVFHNLGMRVETVAEYIAWCKGLETQLEKSGYRRRSGCTPNTAATQTEIHGYKMFKTVIPSPNQTVEIYYLPHKTSVYQLMTAYKKDDSTIKAILDQTLASFTFLN